MKPRNMIEANGDIIKKAISLITDAFEKNKIPKPEGAIAMQLYLKQLEDEGLVVMIQKMPENQIGDA